MATLETNTDTAPCKPQRWNDTKQAQFMALLAETCNVSHAARATGMAVSGIYLRRKSHPAFAAEWDEALATGYALLEAELLHRAREGGQEEVADKDGNVTKVRKISDQLGLSLLKLHMDHVAKIRAMRAALPSEVETNAMRARLVASLDKVKAHQRKAQSQYGAYR